MSNGRNLYPANRAQFFGRKHSITLFIQLNIMRRIEFSAISHVSLSVWSLASEIPQNGKLTLVYAVVWIAVYWVTVLGPSTFSMGRDTETFYDQDLSDTV